jgi:hypothetical protein
MESISFTVTDAFILLGAYLLAWICWGTVLSQLVRRFRLVGKNAVLFILVTTMLLVTAISVGRAAIYSKKAKPTPLFAWTIIGLCMGCVGGLNAERRNKQESLR